MRELYTSNKKFVDFVNEDACIFLNIWEFARSHSVNGHEVISVLTEAKSRKYLLSNDGNIISQRGMKFYVKHEDISGFNPGQSVKIDDELYIVQGVHDVQGFMWAVDLVSYAG